MPRYAAKCLGIMIEWLSMMTATGQRHGRPSTRLGGPARRALRGHPRQGLRLSAARQERGGARRWHTEQI